MGLALRFPRIEPGHTGRSVWKCREKHCARPGRAAVGFLRAQEFPLHRVEEPAIPRGVLQPFQPRKLRLAGERFEFPGFWKDPDVATGSFSTSRSEISILGRGELGQEVEDDKETEDTRAVRVSSSGCCGNFAETSSWGETLPFLGHIQIEGTKYETHIAHFKSISCRSACRRDLCERC